MFHVPNSDRIRFGPAGTDDSWGNNGAFKVTLGKTWFYVIASDGHGWEHVSVSHRSRVPSWEEMCKIKALFWDAEDVVMQLHPRASEYVNNHAFCLHLWRPATGDIPTPPAWMVGDARLGTLEPVREVRRAS